MHFNFIREIPLKLNRPKKSKKENFSQKGLSTGHEIWRSTFSMIFKKSYQQGVFDFFYPDPQLAQIFKPTRNLSGQFFFIYTSIYGYNVYYILKWRKLKDTFGDRPVPSRPSRPSHQIKHFEAKKSLRNPIDFWNALMPHYPKIKHK